MFRSLSFLIPLRIQSSTNWSVLSSPVVAKPILAMKRGTISRPRQGQRWPSSWRGIYASHSMTSIAHSMKVTLCLLCRLQTREMTSILRWVSPSSRFAEIKPRLCLKVSTPFRMKARLPSRGRVRDRQMTFLSIVLRFLVDPYLSSRESTRSASGLPLV